MTITLGSLVIPPEPEPGIPFWYTDLTGWYDLSDDKTTVRARPGAHGAFPASSSWRSAAAIGVRIALHAGSEAELIQNVQRLASLGAAEPISMRVTDALHTTERTVAIRNVTAVDHHGTNVGAVDIDCLAFDPNRYSTDNSWEAARPAGRGTGLAFPLVFPATWTTSTPDAGGSGRLTLTNAGTKESAPRFRVTGECAGVILTNILSQRRVGFRLPIPRGSTVEIDFAARTAVIDGRADASRYLTSRQWWTIPAETPVATHVEFISAGPGALCEGTVKSAW